MRNAILLAAVTATVALAAGRADDGVTAETAWRHAEPGYAWSFPRDLAAHPDYATEWWYVTGNVATDDAANEPLAFQLTFFRVGLDPAGAPPVDSDWATGDLLMAHASVIDPAAGGHVFSEVLWRTSPQLGGFGAPGDSVLAWCRAPAGGEGQWRLTSTSRGFRLEVRDDGRGLRYDLLCAPSRPPVLHGDGGFSAKNQAGTAASLYFSQPRMDVTGTIDRDGEPAPVRGLGWLDREIFTSTLADDQVGWDWLALQLDDGRDLMLYRLRGPDQATDYASGTLVGADGSVRLLHAGDWNWTPESVWRSPETGAEYPVRWRLQLPGENVDLHLRPLLEAQENVSRRSGVRYWEGAVEARRGAAPDAPLAGRGFIELTGYGEGSRPPL